MHSEAIIEADHSHDSDSTDVFGFWLYIMTDCILFATLFATFIVLNFQNLPGPLLKNYINLYDVLLETFCLLISNFTFCFAVLSLHKEKLHHMQFWLLVTFLLGASFVYLEVSEFIHLANEGFTWYLSGRASSFFTLVATHGTHVSFGLLWILFMIIQAPLFKIGPIIKRRMTYLGLFWNFLEIVWIFIFTIVYLTEVV